MSKKRGLSVEEKRSKTLEYFYETKDFFMLKELEKILPKEKGIVAQSVKDVVQSLVDDGLVDSDKIGTSVYFWALPSKASQTRTSKLNALTKELEVTGAKLADVKHKLDEAKKARADDNENASVIAELSKAKVELDDVEKELAHLRDNDPTILDELNREIQAARENANWWTDGVFSLRKWLANKFNMEEAEINKQFNIPDNLDYIDE